MQEVSTTNEQKQCNNPETSNAIARGNTVHTDCHLKGYRACSLSFFIASWLLAVQTVGRASPAECSSTHSNSFACGHMQLDQFIVRYDYKL